MNPEPCSCGRERLHHGTKDFIVKVKGEIVVINAVPAFVCDICDEAYFTPEISRKIDGVMREFHAGRSGLSGP